MRLTSPITRLAVAVALFSALLAADLAAAADAQPQLSGAKATSLGAGAGSRHTGGYAKKRRARLVGLHGSHQVSDAVPVASSSAQAPGSLLFDGSRISDFDLLQEAPGAISETADPLGSGESTLKMTVKDSDVYPITPTDNPRAQALSPSIIQPGEEFWLQTKFMLPEDFPSVRGWMSLVSIYGAPFNGSSPWQIEVADNEIRWQRNDTYDYDIPWRMPLVKGRWVSILTHERFATDGWVEMWVDGQQVNFTGAGPRIAMKTMDSSNDEGPNAAKIMQYRQADMFDSASIYFGPLKLGTSRASVGG
jgi:hypothetical protein